LITFTTSQKGDRTSASGRRPADPGADLRPGADDTRTNDSSALCTLSVSEWHVSCRLLLTVSHALGRRIDGKQSNSRSSAGLDDAIESRICK